MPGKNGYEVAQLHQPVAAAGAHSGGAAHRCASSRSIRTGAPQPAATACSVKPFEPQRVIRRVKELLGRASGRQHLDDVLRSPGPGPDIAGEREAGAPGNPLPQADGAGDSPRVGLRPGREHRLRWRTPLRRCSPPNEQESALGKPRPAPPVWRAASTDGPVATDDLVERVTERVLERLSDRAGPRDCRRDRVPDRRTAGPRRDRADQGLDQIRSSG